MPQKNRSTGDLPAVRCILVLTFLFFDSKISASTQEEHFEKNVRPLLIQRCHKCHAGQQRKGGLRLDSREAILGGGDTGPAITIDRPEQSLLIKAVRHEDGFEMPPDGKLSPIQVGHLVAWVREGAIWPGSPKSGSDHSDVQKPLATPRAPDSGDLAGSLQLWLRADGFKLADGDSVPVWPDQSGHGRDLAMTSGIREGGVGKAARFIRNSTLVGRPAVRFSSDTGMASSPANPPEIRGDAALTITLVMNLVKFDGHPSHSSVFCVGNPAPPGDPGKPLAALVEIDQTQKYSLDFAGGWGHDAILAPGSFDPYFGKPIVLTIVKNPGPIRESTRFFLNGHLAGPTDDQPVTGRDTVPDIQYRSDIGLFLGKALGWCGSFQGDVGEVLLYSKALSDPERLAVELALGEKYGLWIDESSTVARKATYSAAEKTHWAWQPVGSISPPVVKNQAWIRNPIDRFTLSALEAVSRKPAEEIDRRSYLRRVTYDLTGLPPTPSQVEAFLSDTTPQAYETVVDRLLASPHYGERWGRHWLDVVRYAETTANDANAVMRYAWRYRNYVIDAFNNDLPYDQFLSEQLAGDLLPSSGSVKIDTRRTIATGFLMIGSKALAETDKEQSRLEIVDDQIDVMGRAMLGMTIACARCHDHKFDAIRTTDYYALAGIFRSTEPFQNENRNATMWWEFPVSQGTGVEPLVVMAPKESQPRNLRVHLRGNRFTLGRIVPRGVPGIIDAVSESLNADTENSGHVLIDPHQLSSGRRELARWIASSKNPLTARVFVNRVWQRHFGRGIVATSDNFGTRGELPTQPGLLDWLAVRFMQSGWSSKQLHRLIVLSSTYRQQCPSGTTAEEEKSLQPLFVQPRRLSAEEIRDSFLAVSGQLDSEPGTSESGDFLYAAAEDINAIIRPNRVTADDEFYTTFRKRSVYLPIVRNMLPDVLSLFDAADPNGVTPTRNETTVASQGLFLLNHPFVRNQAAAFARKLIDEEGSSDEQRIEKAHRIAFGRSATDVEQRETREFLSEFLRVAENSDVPESDRSLLAWQAFCQSLLCSNEFFYIE